MGITNLDTFRNYLSVTSTTDDAVLEQCLESAESEVEGFCGRSFTPSTGTRYYRSDDLLTLDGIPGGSGTVLYLRGDLLSLGGITNGDGTTVASTDCTLEPRNLKPYQYIRLKSGKSWSFDTDGEIAVTGTWGYSTAVPPDITEAVLEHAKYLRQLRRTQNYDESNPEGTVIVSKGFPAHVRHILENSGRPSYVRGRQAAI